MRCSHVRLPLVCSHHVSLASHGPLSGAFNFILFYLTSVVAAASIDRIISSSNTVNEGNFFNVTCQASGNPSPTNYSWINKDGQLFRGSVLNFINISRAEAGQYRCVVGNRCGKDGKSTTVNVHCK